VLTILDFYVWSCLINDSGKNHNSSFVKWNNKNKEEEEEEEEEETVPTLLTYSQWLNYRGTREVRSDISM